VLPWVSGFWFVLELSSICTFILDLCHDTQSAIRVRHYTMGASLFFFFLSSINSILDAGICLPWISRSHSRRSSLTSPWTVISSIPAGERVTEEPVANFLPRSFAIFLFSSPKTSSPITTVTNLRLFRSTRLIKILEAAFRSLSRASLAAALASFLAASLAARSCAETESVERLAFRASDGNPVLDYRYFSVSGPVNSQIQVIASQAAWELHTFRI
jgi:hypothetical protein